MAICVAGINAQYDRRREGFQHVDIGVGGTQVFHRATEIDRESVTTPFQQRLGEVLCDPLIGFVVPCHHAEISSSVKGLLGHPKKRVLSRCGRLNIRRGLIPPSAIHPAGGRVAALWRALKGWIDQYNDVGILLCIDPSGDCAGCQE
ncbi:MAG TPA: hypothetical protein PLC44_06730 [Saprospiraceae bacterium]|nr:hypothetical protein [Saprospiraceae bacterium]HNO18056.1 hypothetical protein [Saprospiraceae bacterium]